MNLRRHALTDMDNSVHKVKSLISDKHHRLLRAAREVMQGTHHRYCLKYMETNLYKKFKYKGLVNIMWSAAQVYRVA